MHSDGVAGRQRSSHADWDRPWTHSGAAQPSGSQSQHHCSARQDHGQGSRDPTDSARRNPAWAKWTPAWQQPWEPGGRAWPPWEGPPDSGAFGP